MTAKDLVVFIKSIWQIDNHHFSIKWSDHTISTYCLSSLQKHCPCAGCIEARGNKSLAINEHVTAVGLRNIGRYAIKIQFTEGCSAGIYDFPLLRELDKESRCE